MGKSKQIKVVYLPHVHTQEMQKLLQRGINLINDAINESELKRTATQKKTPVAAG